MKVFFGILFLTIWISSPILPFLVLYILKWVKFSFTCTKCGKRILLSLDETQQKAENKKTSTEEAHLKVCPKCSQEIPIEKIEAAKLNTISPFLIIPALFILYNGNLISNELIFPHGPDFKEGMFSTLVFCYFFLWSAIHAFWYCMANISNILKNEKDSDGKTKIFQGIFRELINLALAYILLFFFFQISGEIHRKIFPPMFGDIPLLRNH
ncbi:MAG: hypothetical protein HQM10_10085 [Candidatus Riflebacteria bacterium]|nr:hypothetical protein [Candidatus Riflebacteria bacterium]